MSRIGNMPIAIPKEITVTIADNKVMVKGPKGETTTTVPYVISVAHEDGEIRVSSTRNDRAGKSLFGWVRAQLANDVTGMSRGFTKTLEMSGVGYRATMTGSNLTLSVGFSHPVVITPPQGITFVVQEGKIVVSGANKQLVGQIAADIRAVKKPEPYKGKGIKYEGERVRKKAGKTAKAVGGK